MKELSDEMDTLQQRICERDRLSISRGLTWVEYEDQRGQELIQSLLPYTGHAQIVGITGAPGVGKSTLVNQLTHALRQRGLTVGILAIDPSSPFSGGALLGDRIRMMTSIMDDGVFMRSLANRGHLGGLSRTTRDALILLDAAGFDIILVETVGTGQSEVEVMKMAHTTVVVLAPGLGDDIQAVKAGILEIGQLFVVNKSDRPGADATVQGLQTMLMMAKQHDTWEIPIVKTSSEKGLGMDQVIDELLAHREHLELSGRFQEAFRTQTEQMIESAVMHAAMNAMEQVRQTSEWSSWVEDAMKGQQPVQKLAHKILSRLSEIE